MTLTGVNGGPRDENSPARSGGRCYFLAARRIQGTIEDKSSMKMEIDGDTLKISEVRELGAANASAFRDLAREAMGEERKNVEIDLSRATFLDSCGLGALIALHKTACARNGNVRLLHPPAPVQQILELTRMHHIFEIVKA
jgi:anti-sigma B factor antagonist